MFRIVRLLVLCCIAFVAGVLFERQGHGERCHEQGGTMNGPICVGVAHD